MKDDRDFITDDEFGRELRKACSEAYPAGYRRGTVVAIPKKVAEFNRLKGVLGKLATEVGATIEVDFLQQCETAGYIFLRGKELRFNSSELLMEAIDIAPAVEVHTKLGEENMVEISFALNGLAERI